MAEEKKEERKEERIEEKAAEVKTEPLEAVKAPEGEKALEKPRPAAPKERPSNCAGCNKSIKRKRWYYRNGKYYCAKRCWKNTSKKEDSKKDTEDKK